MTICIPLNNDSREHTQRDLKSQHYKGVTQARQNHQSTSFSHFFFQNAIFLNYILPPFKELDGENHKKKHH